MSPEPGAVKGTLSVLIRGVSYIKKFTLMFRGREMVHPELGFKVMEKIQECMQDFGQAEKNPMQEGRNITMFMNPAPQVKKS